ncbi:MAG: threonylcarbamoyl-AMP synthase [Ignavibacteriales bacterium]|nr:threonylcarbamoyl-AMP synthase [Ignavibacteriales bacterium]MBP9119517.1 threonylcarbamoyl-AMP synthase [Ignavibacterium sp.]
MIEKKKSLLINIDERFEESISIASELFLKGSIFIYPTDTIYGFGGNPFNEMAIKKISEVKGKINWRRYIFLISDIEILKNYTDIDSERYLDFLLSIWPNPVSVILKLNKKYQELLQAETGAFRIPNHRFCYKLISELKMPLVSTSVNRTGNEPMNDSSMIIQEFSNEVDAIFYSNKKSYFEASTLIDLSKDEPALIREGRIKFVELMKKLN